MKLCRIGELGKEKPAMIDKDGSYKDLSGTISDFDPKNLNFQTLEKLSKLNMKDLPTIDKNIKVNIKSLEGKILKKSLRNLIE